MPECSIEGERGNFRCTGYDGSDVWNKVHAAVESIPCEECRIHGSKLMEGIHDHVNVGLGKEPHDLRNYENSVEEIVTVHDQFCSETGMCKAIR